MLYELKMLLKYWFGNHILKDQWSEIWFNKNNIEKVDSVLKNFESLLDKFHKYDTDDNRELVALTILYDQIPRHLYRGTKKAYEYHNTSLIYAKKALQQNISVDLYYIPLIICLIHTENIVEQKLAVDTLEKVQISQEYKIVLSKIINNHYERVSIFGRIPERNRILSRKNTGAETAYLNGLY